MSTTEGARLMLNRLDRLDLPQLPPMLAVINFIRGRRWQDSKSGFAGSLSFIWKTKRMRATRTSMVRNVLKLSSTGAKKR